MTRTLPRQYLSGGELELMTLLADYPASGDGAKALSRYALHMVGRSPAEALRVASGTHPPAVRAAALTELLKNDTSNLKPAEVFAALATLPEAWQSTDLRLKLRHYRALHEPAAAWPELAAADLVSDQAARDDAIAAMAVWAKTDPQAALAAWLATGPTRELAESAHPLAEALFLPELKAGREPVFPAADRAGLLQQAVILIVGQIDPAAAA
ncbi:MAG: hypothetical protein K9M97_11440, partial [Akkermansiaceae bacterium]|nr:hypothetical protein [Akkermansiaceae bacterium]